MKFEVIEREIGAMLEGEDVCEISLQVMNAHDTAMGAKHGLNAATKLRSLCSKLRLDCVYDGGLRVYRVSKRNDVR